MATIPYWNVNVPESERTAECPDFLLNLSNKDEGIVNTVDAEFQVQSWPVVQKLVADRRLDLFKRVPSQLRRYLAYNWKLRQDYGSVMDFVLSQRLQWTSPVAARGKPFEHPDDIKILWNDWPYGIDEKIVHLVVWTKFDLEEDPRTGDLTDAARAGIESFVHKTLSPRLSPDQVGHQSGLRPPRNSESSPPCLQYIWFKNWRSLKSVHAIEHFHVMLYDPVPELIQALTNGDVPLSRRLTE